MFFFFVFFFIHMKVNGHKNDLVTYVPNVFWRKKVPQVWNDMRVRNIMVELYIFFAELYTFKVDSFPASIFFQHQKRFWSFSQISCSQNILLYEYLNL